MTGARALPHSILGRGPDSRESLRPARAAVPRMAPVATPEWIRRGRVPCLDGLRALSIMLVLVEHASPSAALPRWAAALDVGHIGYLGVSMFFGISGFLITLLLVRELDVTAAISLRAFFRRRAYRILPAYIAFLVAVFVLTRLHVFSLTATDWWGALTYTVNFTPRPAWEVGHLWSLSVEEQFYLAWPLIFVWLGQRRAGHGLLLYLAAAPVLRLALWAVSPPLLYAVNGRTPLRLDAIAAGCLLALLATRPELPTFLRYGRQHAVRTAAAASTLLIISLLLGRMSWTYGAVARYFVDAVALAGLIWATPNAGSRRLGRVLESAPLVFIGLLSYSVYLWQQLLLNPHQPHGLTWTASHFGLIVLVSLVSHFAVERPFIRIKNRGRGLPSESHAEPR